MTAFAVLKRFIIVPVETMAPFQPGDNLFQTMGQIEGCVQNQQHGTHARRAFLGLSCWSPSVTLYWWF